MRPLNRLMRLAENLVRSTIYPKRGENYLYVFPENQKRFPTHPWWVLLTAAVLVIGVVTGVCCFRSRKIYRTFDGHSLCMTIEDEESARQAAVFFDPTVGNAPVICEEIIIPRQFNAVYADYNTLQKNFGTDLADYGGRHCRKYSFRIEQPDISGGHTLTLLVCDGLLIGGDYSDNAFDGKMCSLLALHDTEENSFSEKRDSLG